METTFRTLQRALMTSLVLQLPNFDHDFVMECNASGSGVGAVVHQGGGPIAFFSRQMAPQHTELTAYERELIRLVQVGMTILPAGADIRPDGCRRGFHFSPMGDPWLSEFSNFDGFDPVSPPKFQSTSKFWPSPTLSLTQVSYRNPR
jgi:hypothetical protein